MKKFPLKSWIRSTCEKPLHQKEGNAVHEVMNVQLEKLAHVGLGVDTSCDNKIEM